MNYSGNRTYGRKIVKNQKIHLKRLFISWGICIAVGLLMGCIVMATIPSKEEPTEVKSYGTIDGKVFIEEPKLNWSSDIELAFVPLDVPMDKETQEFIYYLSYEYNIEFPFVMALISHESSFKSNTISTTGDYGLMQINKINHEWLSETLGVTNYLDQHENIRAGMFVLRKLFEKYEDPAKVLMAYNMGEGGASRLWESGIYETEYSKKIMNIAVEYKKEISKGESND